MATLHDYEQQQATRVTAEAGRRASLCADQSPCWPDRAYLCTKPAGHGGRHEARLSTGALLMQWWLTPHVHAIGEDGE